MAEQSDMSHKIPGRGPVRGSSGVRTRGWSVFAFETDAVLERENKIESESRRNPENNERRFVIKN
jgi:hypothetical protein